MSISSKAGFDGRCAAPRITHRALPKSPPGWAVLPNPFAGVRPAVPSGREIFVHEVIPNRVFIDNIRCCEEAIYEGLAAAER